MSNDDYIYDPLSRDTYEAIAFNAIGRASEVNNLPAYGLAHSTGNSGWSVGFMQWDFGQPGRGDRADDMLARYQAWAPEAQVLTNAEITSLSTRLRTRGQVGNDLTAEERANLDQFLRSDEGRSFVGELDRQQIERKWDNVGEPLSRIEWLQNLNETSPGQAAEIVAMTSKLYNQNEVRGGRLIQHLQDNTLTSAQTSDWIGDQGIEGLNAMARSAIVAGRDKALVGVRLMNSLEIGEGQLSQLWREEIHENGNVGLTQNFNNNASVQLLDKMMRDPTNGERIRAQLEDDAPRSRVLMTGGVAETSRVELDREGQLTVRSPSGIESILTHDGWIRHGVQVIEQPNHGQGPAHRERQPGPGGPPGHRREAPDRPDPGDPAHPNPVRHQGNANDAMSPAHPDYALFTALKERLPSQMSDDMVGHVMLQAKIGGVRHADKLDLVAVVGDNAFIQGRTPGDRAKVDVSGSAPLLQESLAQSESFDRLQAQQLAQFREQQQNLNEQSAPRMVL